MANSVLVSGHQTALVKAEVTFGTDSSPAAADGISALAITGPTYEAKVGKRKKVDGTGLPGVSVIGARQGKMSIEMDMRNSGTAGTPGDLSTLLQICGMKETDGASDDTYTPDPSMKKSASIYRYLNGKLYKMLGSAGSMKFEFGVGTPGKFTFDLQGSYLEPTDAALVSPTGLDTPVAPPVALGIGLTWNAITPNVQSVSVDLGAQVAIVEDMNQASGVLGAVVTEFNPTMTMKVVEPLVADGNWHNKWTTGGGGALDLTIGATAGNKIDVNVALATLVGVAQSFENGLAMFDLTFDLSDLTLKLY